MRRRRNPEIIAGRVNGDGTIATGDGFTVTRNGVGDYSITLPAGFRLLGVSFTPVTANCVNAGNTTPGERTFKVITFNLAGANVDSGFMFTAVGVQQ